MNILIYDEKQSLCHLIRSALVATGHRTSASFDMRDAILKLDTALFDSVIIGPAGTPRELAEYLDEEMPHIPIVLAGLECETPTMDRIQAILPSPVRLSSLVAAIRRISEAGEKEISEVPVSVSFGEKPLACMANRVTRKGMIVEYAGTDEEFHGFFASTGSRALTAVFAGDDAVEFRGSVKYMERGPAQRVRTVGICFDPVEKMDWDRFCQTLQEKENPKNSVPRRFRKSG